MRRKLLTLMGIGWPIFELHIKKLKKQPFLWVISDSLIYFVRWFAEQESTFDHFDDYSPYSGGNAANFNPNEIVDKRN